MSEQWILVVERGVDLAPRASGPMPLEVAIAERSRIWDEAEAARAVDEDAESVSVSMHRHEPLHVEAGLELPWHEAALSVYWAWDRLEGAKTLPSQANAIVDLSNAMSDLASWLPGYDAERGEIVGEEY